MGDSMSKKVFVVLMTVIVVIGMIGCSNSTDQESTIISQDPENTKYKEIKEFLESTEGMQYQILAYQFAKAFMNGDSEFIKQYADQSLEVDNYDYEDAFSKVEYMIYRANAYDKSQNEIQGEYVILPQKDSSCIYLDFTMKLIAGEWLITEYYLDA